MKEKLSSEASYVWMTDASNSMNYFRVLPENINSYLEKGFIMYEKKCGTCKKDKPLNEFYKNKRLHDGLENRCKSCQRKYAKKYYKKNRDYTIQKTLDWYYENTERAKSNYIKYRESNREKIRNYRLEWERNNWKNNSQYKIKKALSSRIRTAVKKCKGQKSASTIELLGAPIEKVREYLENQFQPGMTWDNHGEWHIDHIKPCVSFDLTKEEEQRRCFHYTNLQPLWAKDNLRKGAKY